MGVSVFPATSTSGPSTLPALGGSITMSVPNTGTTPYGYIEFDFGTPLAAGGYEFTFTGLNANTSINSTWVAVDSSGTVLATQTGTSLIGKLTTTAPIQKVAYKNSGNIFTFSSGGLLTVTPGIKVATKGVPWAANASVVTMTDIPAGAGLAYYGASYYDRTVNRMYFMQQTAYNQFQMYTGDVNTTTGVITWTAKATRSANGAVGNYHYGSMMGGIEGQGKVYWAEGNYYSGSWQWSNTFQSWDFSTNTWTNRTGTQNGEGTMLMQISSTKLLLAGGYNNGGSWYQYSKVYNTSTETWSTASQLVAGIGNASGILLPNDLANATKVIWFVQNSENSSGNALNQYAHVYDVATSTWSVDGNYPNAKNHYNKFSSSGFLHPAYDGTNFHYWNSFGYWKVQPANILNGASGGYTNVGYDDSLLMYDLPSTYIKGSGSTDPLIHVTYEGYVKKYSTTVTFPAYLS